MAHFAELNENNEVIQVIVVHNNELLDENGNESETKGIEFCQSLFGGRWIQTSYNGNFRKNYAAIGGIYDPVRDAFIGLMPPTKGPDGSTLNYMLDEETCDWVLIVEGS